MPGLFHGSQRMRVGTGGGHAGRACRGLGGGMVHLTGGGESSQGLRTKLCDSLASLGKEPDAFDGLLRTGVGSLCRLKEWQHSLSAVGGPLSDQAKLIQSQWDGAGFHPFLRQALAVRNGLIGGPFTSNRYPIFCARSER